MKKKIFNNEVITMDLSKRINFRQQTLVLTLLVVVCVVLSCCGKKAQEAKVYRVGIVSGSGAFLGVADGFRVKMTELGYVEGKNIVYDFHKLNADPTGEQRVVKKFVADKVDLILAFPTDPALAAKAAAQGTGIPVVFAQAGLEGNNLVESVRQPGGNITGLRASAAENTAKRFEFLHELVPQAKRIYLIYDPNYPNTAPSLELLRLAASSLGTTLVEHSVNSLEELQAALDERAALDDIGVDAILVMPDIISYSPPGFAKILKFGKAHNIPIAGGSNYMADLGAMFSYFPDNVEIGGVAATIADKIFKGTLAGTIPVATPEEHLRLNYKAIQELGLSVSEGLLSRANEIIR